MQVIWDGEYRANLISKHEKWVNIFQVGLTDLQTPKYKIQPLSHSAVWSMQNNTYEYKVGLLIGILHSLL